MEFSGLTLLSPNQKMSRFEEPVEFITSPLKIVEVSQRHDEQWVSLELVDDIRRQLQQMDDYSQKQLLEHQRQWFSKGIQLTWDYLDEHFLVTVRHRSDLGYYWRLRTLIPLRVRDYYCFKIRWIGIQYLSEGRCCNYFEIVEIFQDDDIYDMPAVPSTTSDRLDMLMYMEDELEDIFQLDEDEGEDEGEDEDCGVELEGRVCRRLKKYQRIRRNCRLKRKSGERDYFVVQK